MAMKLDARSVAALEAPIRLGPAHVRNRIFVAPHTTNFGEAGVNLVTQRHLEYHRARARGGAGLIITEGIRVHPTSLRRLGIQAYDDSAVPGLRALADTVHGEGATLFGQLLHTGRHSGDDHAGSWAPSPTPWITAANVPHVMNAFDLDELVGCFVRAAARLVAAGFDGMEVHLGHGHLLQQFLSPVTNHRVDGYGGGVLGRMRLAREVVSAVRGEVGGRAAVGARISADEFLPGGLGPDDVVEIVRAIHAESPLDFLHVSHAAYIGAPSLSTQMADMTYGTAPFRYLPAQFKREFPDLPILGVCRIDTLETAAEMLLGGEADLAGFARAHIAEPDLTKRSLGRSPAPPRSCIACNQGCNANLEAITPITCTVNPAVGREREWASAAKAASASRRVLVVGGGPAGIEAATAAARRGHQVSLYDSRPEVGGQLLDLVRMDGRDGFRILLDELRCDLESSGAQVHAGTTLSAGLILAEQPEVVVLASGAFHALSSLTSPGGPAVWDPEDVLAEPRRAGDQVIVVDDLGTWEAYGIALHLAARGARVELVTPTQGFATRVTIYSRLELGRRLGEAGVTVRPMTELRVAANAVTLVTHIGGEVRERTDVSGIVHVRPRQTAAGLLDELIPTGWTGDLYLVGDAYAPRTCQEAIAEGRGVGTVLGVEDATIAKGIRTRPPYRYPYHGSRHGAT